MTESESQQFETIRSWLNGTKNYQQGVMLLKVYHTDQHKVNSLDRYQNEFLLNQLMRELYDALKEKKVSGNPEVTNPVINVTESPVMQSPVMQSPVTDKPQTPKARDLKKLEEIKKARTQLYKEMAKFHSEMCDIAYAESGTLKPILLKHEKARRHELAKLIIDHKTAIDKYWATTDYFEVHGTFPSEMKETAPAPIQLTNAEALRKLMNTRSVISKTEKKIADAKVMLPHQTGRELEKTKDSIAKWETKLQILEAEKLELEKQIHEQKDN